MGYVCGSVLCQIYCDYPVEVAQSICSYIYIYNISSVLMSIMLRMEVTSLTCAMISRFEAILLYSPLCCCANKSVLNGCPRWTINCNACNWESVSTGSFSSREKPSGSSDGELGAAKFSKFCTSSEGLGSSRRPQFHGWTSKNVCQGAKGLVDENGISLSSVVISRSLSLSVLTSYMGIFWWWSCLRMTSMIGNMIQGRCSRRWEKWGALRLSSVVYNLKANSTAPAPRREETEHYLWREMVACMAELCKMWCRLAGNYWTRMMFQPSWGQ